MKHVVQHFISRNSKRNCLKAEWRHISLEYCVNIRSYTHSDFHSSRKYYWSEREAVCTHRHHKYRRHTRVHHASSGSGSVRRAACWSGDYQSITLPSYNRQYKKGCGYSLGGAVTPADRGGVFIYSFCAGEHSGYIVSKGTTLPSPSSLYKSID